MTNGSEMMFRIEASNLGPHKNLVMNEVKMKSCKLAIYARNGSGKTFLSKAFSLTGKENVEDSNKLLHLGERRGTLNFSLNDDKIKRQLKIIINQDSQAIVENNSQYIFHVFNEKYVEDNLRSKGFKPEGSIEGFILGKARIDLSDDREKLKQYQDRIERLDTSLDMAVLDVKSELTKTFKVGKGTKEYKDITKQNLRLKAIPIVDKELSQLIRDLNSLNELPIDLEDIAKVVYQNKKQLLQNDISQIFQKEVSKGAFLDGFKEKIQGKIPFISKGLALNDGLNCPFCEQQYNEQAIDLLDKYDRFLRDEEATILRELDLLIETLEGHKTYLVKVYQGYLEAVKTFSELQQYFPSLRDVKLTELQKPESIFEGIDELIKGLYWKKDNLQKTRPADNIIQAGEQVVAFYDSLEKEVILANQQIDNANHAKNTSSKELLHLKKEICLAKFNALFQEQENTIEEMNSLEKEVLQLQIAIKEKEFREKKSKKDLFVQSLTNLLNTFFQGKYNFEESEMSLTFKGTTLNENAIHILSEGERNIVAFCYYLAEVHKMVESEDDYQKVFFIIDDPISSLDFNYVYAIARIVKTLHNWINTQWTRYIILSHSIEFINILRRNGSINNNVFILDNQEISRLDDNFMMPYNGHLRDIIKVAERKLPLTHTIGNSLRHIIETLQQFESPGQSLEAYFEKNDILKENGFLFTLMQDTSHGGIRFDSPYAPETMIGACKTLLEFIGSKYPEQLQRIKRALN
ncbi:AAA family ATPase [Marinoscillum sp.]|uniref:AAA family ATPase n=1 Tax=Marinoscillum sp. TaxID=2024838 RepID=UPI003BA92FCB